MTIDELKVGVKLKRYELQSPRQRYFEQIRKYVTLISFSLGASIFWGGVVGGILRWAFDLTELNALSCLFTVALILLLFFYLNRHQLARSAGFDDDI